jgi:hypothetical protein
MHVHRDIKIFETPIRGLITVMGSGRMVRLFRIYENPNPDKGKGWVTSQRSHDVESIAGATRKGSASGNRKSGIQPTRTLSVSKSR